jgi:hypothetical protein
MSEPVRQHYIPKSYLKYFATEEKDNFIVDIYDERNEKLLPRQDISSICLKRNLYTLDSEDPNKKYFLELFYAEHVDQHFSEIHDLLTDPEVTTISIEQKQKIISCLLSLYFRTTKFLNGGYSFFERFIDRALSMQPDKEEMSVVYLEQRFKFKRSEVHLFKAKMKEEFRHAFVLSHVEQWTNFFHNKLQNGITICKITEDVNLITSDNPVIIESYDPTRRFNLYDETNIIQVPIDQKHYLFVQPNEVGHAPLNIVRSDRDARSAVTNNRLMQKNSERWIISDVGGIERHLQEQIKYDAPTAENLAYPAKLRSQGEHYAMIVALSAKHGGIKKPEVIARAEEFAKLDIFKDDANFKQFLTKLKQP